jgi:hypothetical protein
LCNDIAYYGGDFVVRKISGFVFLFTIASGLVVGGGTTFARPDYVWGFEDYYSYAVDQKAEPGNVFLSGYTKGEGPDLKGVSTTSKFYKNGTFITDKTKKDSSGEGAWAQTSYYTGPGTKEAEVKTVHKAYTLDNSYISKTTGKVWKK